MSEVKLITKNIWKELTGVVKKSKVKSTIAVAYFGQNASKMLPLLDGSILLVDASEHAVKCGQTCPDELLKLYYKGVQIYSHENLHAKLFVVGKTLYCGSTNVSGNSANRLQESLLKTTDKKVVKDAKEFIDSLCRIELGEDELKKLSKIYRPPKFVAKNTTDKTVQPEFHVCKVFIRDYNSKELVELKYGKVQAEKLVPKKSRHLLESISFLRSIAFKKGDNILQIVTENNKKYVRPIGKLIHIRKWKSGEKDKFMCFVEVRDKNEKPLELVLKRLTDSDAKSLLRAGKKSIELEKRINGLWR